jgi:Flp pilus assembly pilin Flp
MMATTTARIGDRLLADITRCRVLLGRLLAWRAREDGAVAAEYALILGLVAVVIVVAVGAFGTAVVSLFERTNDSIP